MNREPLTTQVILSFLGQTELSAVAIARLAKRPVADVLHVLFDMEDQGRLISRWQIEICDPTDAGKKNFKLYRVP